MSGFQSFREAHFGFQKAMVVRISVLLAAKVLRSEPVPAELARLVGIVAQESTQV